MCHFVLAEDLAVGLIGIGFLAYFRLGKVLVEDIKAINVTRGELRAIDVGEETSSLVCGSNIGRADIGDAVTGLDTAVNPTFDLYLSHQVLNCKVSSASFTCNLFNGEAGCTKSLVECLTNENVSGVRNKVFKDREENRNKSRREERRPVFDWGVDPSEQEVVVTVGETFGSEEELLSCSLVELCASLSAEGHVGDVEVSISCPLLPVRPLVALNAMVRPVPSVLRFDNIEFTIKAESHD